MSKKKDAKNKTYYIYGLVDPRDKSVNYIGVTTQPKRRLITHMGLSNNGRGNFCKDEWIKDLRDNGLRCQLTVLETTKGKQSALSLEDKWIEKGIKLGWPLRNYRTPLFNKRKSEGADKEYKARRESHKKKEAPQLGNWLSEAESRELIALPDTSTIKGLRDRAVMGLLIGCGLRRSEAAELAFEQLQRREGRWVIVDIDGKGHRLRSVPLPGWVKKAIDEYVDQSHDRAGFVFRQTNKHGGTQGNSISPDTIRLIVKHYGEMIGQPKLAPHDLRRTFAQWLRREDVKIEQISVIMGHESIVTTQKYLGIRQDIKHAPNDLIKINI